LFSEKCAKDHPHHTLPHIFALANAHADDSTYKSTEQDARVASATELLNKLKRDGDLRSIIEEFKKLNAGWFFD
jgi:serine-protein kinase ATM